MLFHGWWELSTLFLVLLVACALMGWAGSRGQRPAERGPLVNASLFLSAFALLLLVRYLQNDRWSAIIIAASVLIAGVIVAKSNTRAAVLPMILLAALLGFGLNLSALVLAIASVLVLFFTRSISK